MPFDSLAESDETRPVNFPNEGWLGRLVDAFVRPELRRDIKACRILWTPPPAHARMRADAELQALNTFLDLSRRLSCPKDGTISGDGVGKCMLLSRIARAQG